MVTSWTPETSKSPGAGCCLRPELGTLDANLDCFCNVADSLNSLGKSGTLQPVCCLTAPVVCRRTIRGGIVRKSNGEFNWEMQLQCAHSAALCQAYRC